MPIVDQRYAYVLLKCVFYVACANTAMSSPLCRLGILSYQYVCGRSFSYWPPPSSKRSRIIELPSGKKFFVFRGKRDADGKLEPVVCFIDRNGDRLTWFNTEEVHQLERLTPRLLEYMQLWEAKRQHLD
uniref:Uncharacterized protein n=1 Tax=Babesia bovis TaxID=5865 RepID=S6C926_BABBO|nr:hypothetical protein [Babesia bovis]